MRQVWQNVHIAQQWDFLWKDSPEICVHTDMQIKFKQGTLYICKQVYQPKLEIYLFMSLEI